MVVIWFGEIKHSHLRLDNRTSSAEDKVRLVFLAGFPVLESPVFVEAGTRLSSRFC